MNRIIFLDIDGVLNNTTTFMALKERHQSLRVIDPLNMEAVDKLVWLSGSDIVVSSSWRHAFDVHDLRDIFRDFGSLYAVERIIDSTPRRVNESITSVAGTPAPRAWEIQEWISQNDPKSFVIFDDDEVISCDHPTVECMEMQNIMKRFIRTDPTFGLTDVHIKRALKILL